MTKNLVEKSKKVSKSTEFNADFKSAETVLKNVPKKVISRIGTKICTFSTFTHVRQTCFACNFFCKLFKTFPMDLKSALNSAFLIPLLIFSN